MRLAVAVAPGVFRIAEADVVRMAVGAGKAFSASAALAARGEGDLGRMPAPLEPPAERKGEAVRETTGGVADRDGGLLGRLIVGLSQEEKKSSAGSPEGVEVVPSDGVGKVSSVMTTWSGNLGQGGQQSMMSIVGARKHTLQHLLRTSV